jgi:hypothetical protein
MAIQVLIERVGKNGYRATSGEPLAVSVEAPTREAALAKLKKKLDKRLSKGAELVSVELAASAEENPWVEFAGMFKDDPKFAEVVQIMKENRKKDDENPDFL